MAIKKDVKEYFKKEHLGRPLIKYFYYPIAIFFCRIYAFLGISAHFANLFGLFASLLAAVLVFYLDGIQLVIPGLLVMFAYVSDLCDGTMARYYGTKNAMGKWLDESAGFIGVTLVFFSLMMKTFFLRLDYWIIILGFIAIFGYLMMNIAAILSEMIRDRFKFKNAADKAREEISKKFFGINPNIIAFSFDIQWTLVALGVMFNAPYLLFIVFGVLSNLQWMARYIIFWGK